MDEIQKWVEVAVRSVDPKVKIEADPDFGIIIRDYNIGVALEEGEIVALLGEGILIYQGRAVGVAAARIARVVAEQVIEEAMVVAGCAEWAKELGSVA